MLTDERLLDLVHQGDQEALGILYEKYFDRVLNYSYRRTFDKQIAYDITANVFMTVAEKIHKFKPQHENAFVAWLFKIASNEVVGYYRKPHKYKSSVGFDEDVQGDMLDDSRDNAETLDTLELYKKLHVAMEGLKPNEQNIVDLYYFENLSYKEIAASTGVKESNVGVILHRTLKKLHIELEPLMKGAVS